MNSNDESYRSPECTKMHLHAFDISKIFQQKAQGRTMTPLLCWCQEATEHRSGKQNDRATALKQIATPWAGTLVQLPADVQFTTQYGGTSLIIVPQPPLLSVGTIQNSVESPLDQHAPETLWAAWLRQTRYINA